MNEMNLEEIEDLDDEDEEIDILENFLGGTFHQDMGDPDDELWELLREANVSWLEKLETCIREFLESELDDSQKEKFITDEVYIYFPAFNTTPLEWLKSVLETIKSYKRSLTVLELINNALRMDETLLLTENKAEKVLRDYIVDVERACEILLNGINTQEKLNIKTKYQLFEYLMKTHKNKFVIDDMTFQLHGGRGCFLFSEGLFLSWDFGYRSRWCGIDPYKVGMTLKENKSPLSVFYDGTVLKDYCDQAVDNGEMICKYNMYYFTVPDAEMFKPDFPKDYDTLMIEGPDEKWTIRRNSETDRFVRKSNKVHNEIFNKNNVYILHFFSDGKEVYSIPYDDVCYPENAVSIFSDNIICNLKKNKK